MRRFTLVVLLGIYSLCSFAQYKYSYDEGKVPEYVLPDVLVTSKGENVTSSKDWEKVRRPEVLQLFSKQVYGFLPQVDISASYKVLSKTTGVFGGLAMRKQIEMTLSNGKETRKLLLLLYIPQQKQKAYPAFFVYNFAGNHTIYNDPDIIPSDCWSGNLDIIGVKHNKSSEAIRGCRQGRWPLEMILSRGYAIATMCYNDVFPDHINGFEDSVLPLMGINDRDKRDDDAAGAIAAWAWGMGRVMDYFEQDRQIDKEKVMIMGHSRLGKAALWAGAIDQRFKIVYSNNSGCSGAALSRRKFGETVDIITTAFPHWFCKNYRIYKNQEEKLPVDQHELLSLIAPRPVYVASAAEDLWADPKGEYLSAYHAGEVYQLYGYDKLPDSTPPSLNYPLFYRTGYHIRDGKHEVTAFDWYVYINYADKWLK